MNDHEKMEMIRTPGSLYHGKDRSKLERNFDMIKMRQQGKTLDEIAKKHGLSQSRVGQIICKSARNARRRNPALFDECRGSYGTNTKEALEIFERIGI